MNERTNERMNASKKVFFNYQNPKCQNSVFEISK